MRWLSTADTLRALVPAVFAIGTGVLGFADAKPREQRVFAVCALIGIVAVIADVRHRQARIEPESVRKRCQRVLGQLAQDVFHADPTVELTLFLPNDLDGDATLVPVARYTASNKAKFWFRSRARFKPTSSSIISGAWARPGRIRFANIPRDVLKTDEQARGWFQTELLLSEKEAKRLSERTLRLCRCVASIALSSPLLNDGRPIALIGLTSEQTDAFNPRKHKQQRINAFERYTESIAILVTPIG